MRQHTRRATAVLVLINLLALAACASLADAPASSSTLEVQISDHRVAIGDFERLDITIKNIGLHPANAPRTGDWLDFAPDTPVVDLTQVVNAPALPILQATMPPGIYDAVRVVVAGGQGMLKDADTVEVLGFEEATRLAFTARRGDTIKLVMDVVVESRSDHPGGGYEMHLLDVTIK